MRLRAKADERLKREKERQKKEWLEKKIKRQEEAEVRKAER